MTGPSGLSPTPAGGLPHDGESWLENLDRGMAVLEEVPRFTDRLARRLEPYTGRRSALDVRRDEARALIDRAVVGYVRAACQEWRRQRPQAPDWMLPILDELPDPHELGSPYVLPRGQRWYGRLLAAERDRLQPPLAVDDAAFPGGGETRTWTPFTTSTLSDEQQDTFRHWFHDHGTWHTWPPADQEALQALVTVALPTPGLVWRQHKVQLDLDGIDLRTAEPGATFQLPYPVSCRFEAVPMASIGAESQLPRRAHLQAGGAEQALYLEIWARQGKAFDPPYFNAPNESEVLLPAGSRFRVIRHVDLPHHDHVHPRPNDLHSHGLQVLQLTGGVE
ncbi:hypothetical protein JCM18899A_52040 [Nocardioides sp. AN3]|jgi:hypothetical protein